MRKNEWEYAHQKGIVAATTEVGSLPFLQFSEGNDVLDIGCGKGTLLRKLVEDYGVEGVGIDIVPTKTTGITFVCAEAQNLPFKEGVFDIVYSLGVLEHLTCTEKAFVEAHRVLKTDGQVLITVPNLFSLHTFLDRPLRHFLGLWHIGLEKSYSLLDVYCFMAQAGFQKARHKLILWNLSEVSVLSSIYAKFDNFLSRVFMFWGFFIAIYSSK